ncbi:MAG: hypothetical protein AAFZ14_04995, partial [Pseudomonadota bacterium]
MSSTDNTQPPKRPEAPEEDNDRTLIAPMPAAEPPAAPPEEEADRTIIAPMPAGDASNTPAPEDADRTIIGEMPVSPPAQPATEDGGST